MTKQRERYLETLIEAIAGELVQIHEALSLLVNVPARLDSLENKIEIMSRNQDAFILALRGTNKQVSDHEFRISKLEAA